MNKRIPTGISSFHEVINDNYYYIDKTDLCRKIIEDLDKIAVMPRPRRFGKTLNVSMLQSFFEKRKDGTSHRDLFKGLSIEKWQDFDKHQGHYPVIFFTFKEAKGKTKEDAFYEIKKVLSNEYKNHKELLENDVLEKDEIELFNAILSRKADERQIREAAFLLCKGLSKFYNERVMVFIDEYDTPIQSSWLNGYYDDMINFIRPFMSAVYKDNDYLMRGVITGIMRVTKESIFSGLNNCTVYSIIDSKASTDFGFTNEEVDKILADYNISDYRENVREWYDGYYFGETTIYNPWSILNFTNDARHELKPYWVNTSSNDIIRELISSGSISLKDEFLTLYKGGSLLHNIHVDIVFPEIKSGSDNIWSFLYFSGYLKAKFNHRDEDNINIYELTIPNTEIKIAFQTMVKSWFSEAPVTNDRQILMLNALRKKDFILFTEIFKEFVVETLSYFDTSGKYSEATYQAFLLGLLVNMADYVVTSNVESGHGRYDIMLCPRDITKPGYVFELKTIRKYDKDADPNAIVEDAIKQAVEKGYVTRLRQQGVNDITIVGAAFDGKVVTMRME